MIPGTAKETAALALSKIAAAHAKSVAASISALQRMALRSRELELAERRQLARKGKLPRSSRLPFAVALDVDHVDVEVNRFAVSLHVNRYGLKRSVEAALLSTVNGKHDLWFSIDDGNAFVSVAHMDDATLFRLALEGGQ